MDDESFFTHTLEQTDAHRIHEKTMLTKKKCFQSSKTKKTDMFALPVFEDLFGPV